MAISDLANAEPNILRKWFSDIYILLGKVTESKHLMESNLRDLSFEIIVCLVENHPKNLSNDKEKLKVFIQSLFKYALEMDMELDEEWTTPKTLTFIEEDVVPEQNLQLALGMIERLCEVMPDPQIILENLVQIVQELLANSSTEWKFKYTAFMTICSMCEEISDISEVKNIFPTVFQNIQNEHPKIRFACMQVIEAAIDKFNPYFQEQYTTEILPFLLQGVKDPVLRCQLQTCETISSFIDTCPESIIKQHIQSFLDVLFPILLAENSAVSLQDNILSVLSNLTHVVDENDFKPYAEKCLDMLLNYFSRIISSGKDKSLYGPLLELITSVGPICKEKYITVVPNLVKSMIDLQNTIPYSTDPLFDYLSSAWEKTIPIIKESYKDLIVPVIECTLKLVNNVPTMKVSSDPEQTFNIQDLLKDDSQDPKIVKQKVQVNTSETKDYAGSISLLSSVIESFGDAYANYIEVTEKVLLVLLTFEVNDEIRIEASCALPLLLDTVKKMNNVDSLHQKAKTYLSSLILAVEKETFNGVIGAQLEAIGAVIEKTGLFLQEKEIQDLFIKLLQIFDKVELSRLDLLKEKQSTADEFEKNRKEGNDKINSDDEEDDDEEEILDDMEKELEEIEEILVTIADIMGSMFKTHKELTLNIVKELVDKLLPKYFQNNSTTFEVKMGLFIIDDMIEFLGENYLPQMWNNLGQLVLKYVDDKEPTLRQASVYGLGEFAINTKSDFSGYAHQIVEGIEKAIYYGDDGQSKNQWKTARDNAVSALGKVIKYQSSKVDLPKLVNIWVKALPLNEDDIEGQKQHKIFVEMLHNNADLVLGSQKENLTKVLRILCKICDTKFVDTPVNDEVKKILGSMKANQQFAEYIQLSISEADKDLKEKMIELLK